MSGNSVERRFDKKYESRRVSRMTPFRQVNGVHVFLPPFMLVTHFATEMSPWLVWKGHVHSPDQLSGLRFANILWVSGMRPVCGEGRRVWSVLMWMLCLRKSLLPGVISLSLKTVVSKKEKIGKFLQNFKSNTQMQSDVKFQCHVFSATCTLVNVPWEPPFEITVS